MRREALANAGSAAFATCPALYCASARSAVGVRLVRRPSTARASRGRASALRAGDDDGMARVKETYARKFEIAEDEADRIIERASAALDPVFREIDRRTQKKLEAVLSAFRKQRVDSSMFGGVDGYGHGDLGREALDAIYAELFGCEDALVRIQFCSGTHAIAAALYGVLRPGDELLSLTGAPYDTLEEVIGTRSVDAAADTGSLADLGVSYRELALRDNGTVAIEKVREALRPETRMVFIQRSCGYSWRASLSRTELAKVIAQVRAAEAERGAGARGGVVVFVDNCYGELVDDVEPSHPSVGADLVAGSLIKNCGGTIAPSGGYVAGRADLVRLARNRFAAPGVAGAAALSTNKALLQGLFLAPQMVGEALKGAHLVAAVMHAAGYAVNPNIDAVARSDIIQAVRLGDADKVVAFCRAVQRCSPVGAHILPEGGTTPGYADAVVFADGTFVDGSTLELSADGPLREPYVVYAQGGTHWTHWAIVLKQVLRAIGRNGARDVVADVQKAVTPAV